MILGSLFAFAAEPPTITPTYTRDGAWRADLVVPVPVASAKAALADPIAAARFSPDITEISYLAQGACPTLRARTGGSMGVTYDYRRCATADGWHETLVESGTLDVYEVRWSFTPDGAGTRVAYQVKVDPIFPTPDFLLAGHMKSSIATVVGRFYRAVTGG
jgi:hypothetical protein